LWSASSPFGASSTAYGLHDDRASGVIDRFRSLPTARSAVLAGRTLADLTRSSVILLLQLGAGILLGFRWRTGIPALLAGVALALAFGYAWSWIMATPGLAGHNTEAIQAAVYSVVFPFTLVSSVFLPTQTMPGWLQAFAEHQPITVVANALRGPCSDRTDSHWDRPSPVRPCSPSPGPQRSWPYSYRWPCASTAAA